MRMLFVFSMKSRPAISRAQGKDRRYPRLAAETRVLYSANKFVFCRHPFTQRTLIP
jgi:hypothetical protein